jgi:hypothetical protein
VQEISASEADDGVRRLPDCCQKKKKQETSGITFKLVREFVQVISCCTLCSVFTLNAEIKQ